MKRLLRLLLLAFLVPVLVYAALYASHTVSYDGICGPHAPDIAAHSCTFAEHQAEFAAGFAGVGVFLLTAGSFAVSLPLCLGVWMGRGAEP